MIDAIKRIIGIFFMALLSLFFLGIFTLLYLLDSEGRRKEILVRKLRERGYSDEEIMEWMAR
ncbi:MAG: hypothetical protein J7L20_03875 [Thermoplasmata archaeon]|nr:hypothetical protein [Thermoplasmata archaeon]